MPGDGIHQGSVKVAASWMHHHTCRFVNHHQVVILINHFQWDILGFYRGIVMGPIKHQGDDIARTHLIVALYRFFVHMDKPCIGSLLDAVTTGVRLMLNQVLINTDRHLTFIHFHTKMFVQQVFLLLFFDIDRFVCHSFTSSKSSTSPSPLCIMASSSPTTFSSSSALYCPLPTSSVSGCSIETRSPVETLRPLHDTP